ncbi:Splicing factor U2AF 26 kDa subunit [Ameca splendens]|uniref:Splicing factor U2AF 26 kDa subunit n=1 Tax=Ameca splendens TaxID=208324 RepID=A0ABV0XDU1_9TELE
MLPISLPCVWLDAALSGCSLTAEISNIMLTWSTKPHSTFLFFFLPFQEVFTEMEEKYGEVEEMNVCDNLGDHLVGNVYVKFRNEEDAEKAVIDLNNRWFNGQPIHAELSPVTDFREACCRQYEMG